MSTIDQMEKLFSLQRRYKPSGLESLMSPSAMSDLQKAAGVLGVHRPSALESLMSPSAMSNFENAASAIGVHRPSALESLMSPSAMSKLSIAAQPAIDALASMQKALGENSAMGKLSQQIAAQQKTIDAFRGPRTTDAFHHTDRFEVPQPPRMPQLRIPPNPLHQTNKHLKEIQLRFDRMEAIAVESASIATSLQASAAEFLDKFEKAAKDNDRTAKRALRIGVIATVIAIATFTAQIVYTEFWRGPADTLAAQTLAADLKTQISALQDQQRAAAEKLSDTITRSNEDISVTLKQIRDLLAKKKPL